MMGLVQRLVMIVVCTLLGVTQRISAHNYGEALTKSILFFEGQRSGKLPSTQRLTWRKHSALQDGIQLDHHQFFDKVDLVGGYYDAGDNVKFNFPMAFSTTMLAWSVIEFGKFMDPDLKHALDAIGWATDYFLKSTNTPGIVFAQVGDPHGDHNCWQRPEDMDTPRTVFFVSKEYPGSEVSAEIAAALAASSIVFRKYYNLDYSETLLQRAISVFEFADKYRGSYNDSLGHWVCPFYCNYGGYQDELVWGASWLLKATKLPNYWNYINQNIQNVKNFGEFGWDTKDAGINVLLSKLLINNPSSKPFTLNSDKFICSVIPESPSLSVSYSKGGLLFKSSGSNLQHATSFSFLLLVYASYLNRANKKIDCGGGVLASSRRLKHLARSQVDYILGSNPLNMSYMVGYGPKFPLRIHHRGSSLPSIHEHPSHIGCKGGSSYYQSPNPNPNLLLGAVVGGPDIHDSYEDSRADFVHSEPTTYINAPLVGVLAYFKAFPS